MVPRSLCSTLIVVALSVLTIPSAYAQTAPVISGVDTSNPTSNSVTITWETDRPTRCRIQYGETTSYGKSTEYSRVLTSQHKVTIRRLDGLTSYHYRIIAKDRYGVTSTSEDFSFTTKDRYASEDSISINYAAVYSTIPHPITFTQPPTEERDYFAIPTTPDEAVDSTTPTPDSSIIDKRVPILHWTGEGGFSDDGVNPDTGYGSTIFEFRIRYLNSENKAPSVHRVYIDKNGDGDFEDPGEVNDMFPQGDDYINGVIYSYSTNIPYSEASNGSKYYFEFFDGSNIAQGEILAGYSPQTAIDGPVVSQTLSISISPNAWDIGDVEVGTTATMKEANKLTVTNDGDGREDLTLSLANPDVWIAGSQPGAERFVLNAAFSHHPENIIWDEETHLVTTEPVISTEARFAGDQNGTDVPPGETRDLFLQFKSPTQTKVTDSESIRLIISCEVPKN